MARSRARGVTPSRRPRVILPVSVSYFPLSNPRRCNMKSYNTEHIRNVGIVGHGDTGKTQLVSSLLFAAGMTPRLGKVTEGSAGPDWDEEEIARKISINTGVAYAGGEGPGEPG